LLRDGGSHASFALEVAKANFLFEFVVVCTENLSSGVVVVKSAKDGV